MIHTLFGPDLKAGLFVIFNILLMETLLSVDNAAVLAIMVGKLPKEQKPKALEYGIWGAFILRGVCLCLVSWLVSIWWLKIVGGFYLMYLTYSHFSAGNDSIEEASDPDESVIFKFFHKYLGVFWSTVVLVEIMDLTFSMDNIFAVTAFTSHIGLICTGVFIGIVAMRFVATLFIKLIERFPFLENVAFIVIGILGVKLALTFYTHFAPTSGLTKALLSHNADLITSASTMLIFAVPIITSILFNYPKKPVPPVPTVETAAAAETIAEITN